MKKILGKWRMVAPVALLSLVFNSCYEKFDASSYAPEFTIAGFTAVNQIQPASLVAYWPFDGDLKDQVSGNSLTNAGTGFANGFRGQAISLDVANKTYATFNPGATITGVQSFTISFWVNPTFVDGNGDGSIDGIIGFVNLSNPANFWGNIDWFVENGSTTTSAKIVAHIVSGTQETWMNVSGYKGLFGTWTNHTLTYDATTSKLTYYINGAVGTSATAAWTGPVTLTGSGPMVFGCVQFQTNPSIGCCGNQSWASYLTGNLDEVRIYKTALKDTEVNALVVLQGKGK